MTDRPNMLTLTAIKKRGWTDGLIRSLLGDPDLVKTNPRGWSRAPMRLWKQERVEQAEATDEWQEAQERLASRRAKARQRAAARRAEKIEWAETVEIYVRPGLDLGRLEEAVRLEHCATRDTERHHVLRWIGNEIRHGYSSYERLIDGADGDIYRILRERTDRRIAELYPDLDRIVIDEHGRVGTFMEEAG